MSDQNSNEKKGNQISDTRELSPYNPKYKGKKIDKDKSKTKHNNMMAKSAQFENNDPSKQNRQKIQRDKQSMGLTIQIMPNHRFYFIPESKIHKGKQMKLLELLYGEHYTSKNRVQQKWRKIFMVSLFVSMLYRAFEKIRKLGAVRSHQHLMCIEQQKIQNNSTRRKKFILYPDHKFKKIWNINMIVILVTVGLFTPFRVCFVESESLEWIIIDYIYDFIFLVDICVNFISSYIDDDNQLIDDRKKIALKYLQGWFWIDFMAILPIQHFLDVESGDDGQNTAYNKLLRLLRLPRLYRLLRLLKLGKSGSDVKKKLFVARLLSMLHINEGLIKVLVLLVNILFLNHLVACFWHFLAKFEDFNEDTWVSRYGLNEKGMTDRYTAAFYWSFQTLTTVGYGDIAPQTPLEQIYAMLWMFFGVGFFSYTLGNLSAIMSSIDKKTAEYNRKVNQFNDFAFKVKLPVEIRNKVHTYYQNNFYKMMYSNLDPNQMIQELPQQLAKDLLLYCYEFLKYEISLFQLDQNFTSRIILNLFYLEAEKGDIMYREGDNPEEIFFLGSGKINLVDGNGSTIVSMIEGCFFGEIEVLESIPKRNYFAVAQQHSSIYFIKKDIFLEILQEFPHIEKEILLIIKRRKEKYKICQMLAVSSKNLPNKKTKDGLENNQTLKKSTDYYLNLLIMYKEKALQKKYKLNIFQSKEKRLQNEEKENKEREEKMAELRKNLSSSPQKNVPRQKLNSNSESEEKKHGDDFMYNSISKDRHQQVFKLGNQDQLKDGIMENDEIDKQTNTSNNDESNEDDDVIDSEEEAQQQNQFS